jgi:N-acetylmuramoyl-L-alanine amidase
MRLIGYTLLLLICGADAIAGPTIAVDVGHSRAVPGATSAHGRVEFEFNLELAADIDTALRRNGLATRLIGAEGDMARLSARTASARGADFLLSVHHDSVQPHFLEGWQWQGGDRLYSDRYSGFSLFVSHKNPALAASLRCASAIGAALRQAGFRPSLYHAERIPGESKPFADRENGVHYYDNLVVLITAASPAVLLEAGVIVNREEAITAAEPETRRRMAAAVAAGVSVCVASRSRP